MSKKRKIRPWSPTVTEGYLDDKTLWNRLQEEEREAAEAANRNAYLATPVGKAETEYTTTLREYHARLKKFWSQSVAELNEFEWRHMLVDPLGDYATETDRNTDADRVVFDEFYHFLTAQSITLTNETWLKFFKFVACLVRERNIKISKETLLAILQRCKYELQIFKDGDVIGEIPKPAQPVQLSKPQPTEKQLRELIESGFDKIPDTREGRKAAMQIIGSLYGYDVAGIYRSWAEQMERDWHVDVITPKITKFAGEFFMRHNLNPLTPKNYDLLRRVLSKQGLLSPLDYRTKEEKLADALEESDLDSRDVRQAFARHTREILESPGRKGGITL
jgi:hypothetical protein